MVYCLADGDSLPVLSPEPVRAHVETVLQGQTQAMVPTRFDAATVDFSDALQKGRVAIRRRGGAVAKARRSQKIDRLC